MNLSKQFKKGIYYVFVTGSGVRVETVQNNLNLGKIAEFSSYCSLLNFLKIHNIKYKVLDNKWDIQVL